jgi:2-polyprenyl-3-methyl-5-hydroxy-6-metoxy-1,4-benzoquinol methylase
LAARATPGLDGSGPRRATIAVVDTYDKSNGYEQIASAYISGRHAGIGADEVGQWARALPPAATILDLGCGSGVPISETLINAGFNVHGVDASPTMVAAFRARFPQAPVQCVAVADSDFFGRTFDAIVAWGLIFLLDADEQRRLTAKMASVLTSGGRMLFTAPHAACSWRDAMTGQTSRSLGFDEYRKELEANGLSLVGARTDAGENHYYLALKR